MGIIIIKAKVKLLKEEDFEWDEDTMGSRPDKTPRWGWKDRIIHTDNIYEITSISKELCVIEDLDAKRILVNETLEQLFEKWKENITQKKFYKDSNENEETT